MDKQNNLIYDYCIENKVAIHFTTNEQFDMIHALFEQNQGPNLWEKTGGYISFSRYKTESGITTTGHIGPIEPWGFMILSAEEFFTFALPNKSILESIK